MAADFGLVAHAAERLAHEFAARRLRDRAAERRLADTRRADEAKDRPLEIVGARLNPEIFDAAVLALSDPILVVVESTLPLADFLFELLFLAPRPAEQRLQTL